MGKDKKQKKNRDEKERSDSPDSLTKNITDLPADDNSKVKRKSKAKLDISDDLPSDILSNVRNSSDSELEIITLEQQGKKKKKSKKDRFKLLEIEDGDMEIDNQEDSKTAAPDESTEKDESKQTKSSKKSKKKERKEKKKDEDEDLDKILEELALEMSGVKPPPKDVAPETSAQDNITSEVHVESVTEKKSKKKKKKETTALPEISENKEGSCEPTDEVSTVKTTQKKKEKKDREKPNKSSENDQANVIKPESEEQIPEALNDEADGKEIDETDQKKKKKKKRADEEEKKDKKRPGKKQIAAMQEALRKVKEEEERIRLEEEAKIKAAEEAERLRQEQIRLEQERKERKKQKEKEKRERLKAEGKLLTKAQKQNRARMEATLAALREQGIEVPQVGEKKERVVKYTDRKKAQKKKQTEDDSMKTETVSEEPKPEIIDIKTEPSPDNESEAKQKSDDASEADNVKEDWFETSSDEDDSEKQGQTSNAPVSVEVTVKSGSKESENETSSSESEESTSEESESEEESESSSDEDGKRDEASIKERIKMRIQRRRELAESNRSLDKLRSPVVCVLGHVDTGKTKILDKIRSTHVQDGEAGGITQQIGATMVPHEALKEQCKMVKNFAEMELKVPGLLIIDTPGHESFSNLRSRGSSLCDIAILVVDITHGLEPQTIESINMLKQRKTPFVVALNKIDRIYDWKTVKNKDIEDVLKSQSRPTKQFFQDRVKQIILEFANQSLNAVLSYENTDPRSYISMVPTSAVTGEGMGNLMALIVELTQSMMSKKLSFSEDLQATVLEVKAISGLGHTMDAILVNGRLREGDNIIFAGYDGPVCSQIRSLLMPQPLKELRVKTQFIEYREVEGSQGVKITGKDFDKAIAGLPILVPHRSDEIKVLMEEMTSVFQESLNNIKVTGLGVYVQTSTLGSLEALMEFLNESKIPVSGVRIGPVTKKDVMKSSAMLEHDPTYAVILAFDVKIEKEAQELADSLNIKIFHANIIYHLFDMFVKYRQELKDKNRETYKHAAVFPCKLRILPQFVFNSRDPIVVGVSVEAGIVKEGTPLCVPSKEFLDIGTVTTIEVNHKQIESARKGQEVCIKIEPSGGEAPKMYGRHFDHTDLLVSKISRYSIDICKQHFRDDLLKTDWQLMVELKKLFQIL